jgi:hypothetical protein
MKSIGSINVFSVRNAQMLLKARSTWVPGRGGNMEPFWILEYLIQKSKTHREFHDAC